MTFKFGQARPALVRVPVPIDSSRVCSGHQLEQARQGVEPSLAEGLGSAADILQQRFPVAR
jgi:hypothetical protein